MRELSIWRDSPLVWGRVIMPMSLGCAGWTAYNAWVILTGQGLGSLLSGPVGMLLGVVSALTSVLLVAGWVMHRSDWMRHGILLTACLLGATSITVWSTSGIGLIGGGYNVPWLAMCAVAWLIEVRDVQPGRP